MTVKKFLAIAFMCHQKPERSFHFRGKQFPLCARCTGIFVGYFFGIVTAYTTHCEKYLYFLLLILPMIIDGSIQNILKIESNNCRRFITGFLGGIGIIYLLISIHMFTVWWVTKFLEYIKIL